MTKRAGKKYPQDPHQWYREPPFAAEHVFASLDMKASTIWDASCGGGNILDVAKRRGFRTVGSDIVDRPTRTRGHEFVQADFLRTRELPFRRKLDEGVTLFCNPPYGKVAGVENMGEEFVKHALEHFADVCERLVFMLPIEFMAGQTRYAEIYRDRRPSHALIHCQRPSMPPGAMVEDMGADAYRGGMADYATLVWTRGGPYRCETIFMEPSADAKAPRGERRAR